MGWHKIKLDKADIYFSRYIRSLTKKCVVCGRLGGGESGIEGLQASHYHGRRKESVRYDEQNVDPMCISCHKKLGTDDRVGYDEFKLKQLGQREFDLLLIRANTPQKRDRKIVEIYYKAKLKEMGIKV